MKATRSADATSPATATMGASRPTSVHSACMRPTWMAKSVATYPVIQRRS
jgi:hypothetical protein